MKPEYLYIYYTLLGITLFLSVVYSHSGPVRIIMSLLIASILTELGTELCKYKRQNYYFLYHLFIPVEYALIMGYFLLTDLSLKIKKWIRYSIPAFILVSLGLSFYIIPLHHYPGLQANIEGLLIVLCALVSLLSIKPRSDSSIFSEPVFWISSAFFVYYTGVFFINGFFNFFFLQNNEYAKRTHAAINALFNYILYIGIGIGIVCSGQMRKSY